MRKALEHDGMGVLTRREGRAGVTRTGLSTQHWDHRSTAAAQAAAHALLAAAHALLHCPRMRSGWQAR
eukprot:2441441-Rhodomonas_salina.2